MVEFSEDFIKALDNVDKNEMTDVFLFKLLKRKKINEEQLLKILRHRHPIDIRHIDTIKDNITSKYNPKYNNLINIFILLVKSYNKCYISTQSLLDKIYSIYYMMDINDDCNYLENILELIVCNLNSNKLLINEENFVKIFGKTYDILKVTGNDNHNIIISYYVQVLQYFKDHNFTITLDIIKQVLLYENNDTIFVAIIIIHNFFKIDYELVLDVLEEYVSTNNTTSINIFYNFTKYFKIKKLESKYRMKLFNIIVNGLSKSNLIESTYILDYILTIENYKNDINTTNIAPLLKLNSNVDLGYLFKQIFKYNNGIILTHIDLETSLENKHYNLFNYFYNRKIYPTHDQLLGILTNSRFIKDYALEKYLMQGKEKMITKEIFDCCKYDLSSLKVCLNNSYKMTNEEIEEVLLKSDDDYIIALTLKHNKNYKMPIEIFRVGVTNFNTSISLFGLRQIIVATSKELTKIYHHIVLEDKLSVKLIEILVQHGMKLTINHLYIFCSNPNSIVIEEVLTIFTDNNINLDDKCVNMLCKNCTESIINVLLNHNIKFNTKQLVDIFDNVSNKYFRKVLVKMNS